MKQDLLPYLERVAVVLGNVGYARSEGTTDTPGFLVQGPGGDEVSVLYVAQSEFADAGPIFRHWMSVLTQHFGAEYSIELHTNPATCSNKRSRVHIHMTPR